MADWTPAIAAVAAPYRLVFAGPRRRGRLGQQRGVGAGSSLEFLDFRDYQPGDDLRHLDWRSYARTGQLRVRLFQAEVAPHVDLLVDDSASMAVTAAKASAAQELLQALGYWLSSAGLAVRCLRLGGDTCSASSLRFDATDRVLQLPLPPLRQGGLRILLTDGLWAADPLPAMQRLLAGAAQFVCLQLLDPWELAPGGGPAQTLVDVESGDVATIQLDAPALAAYQQRLQRCLASTRTAVLASAGLHALLRAAPLAELCREGLLPQGVLEPA